MARKTVLITGASEGGIGDGLAQEFHSRGLRVFATARDLDKVKHLKEMGMEVWSLDVTARDSIEKTLVKVRELTGGRLDFLVNNAGIGYQMPMLDSDVEVVKSLFETNVFGVLSVTQLMAPLLIEAKGTIINIGSVAGEFALVYSGGYNASKAALRAISENLRVELMPFNVRVITVITAIVRTRLFQNLVGKPTLPSSSLYMPIKDTVQVVMDGHKLFENGQEPREFAKGVVDNALRTSPEMWLWKGGRAKFVWFATSLAAWLPRTWFDHALYEDAGLNQLKNHYQEKAKRV